MNIRAWGDVSHRLRPTRSGARRALPKNLGATASGSSPGLSCGPGRLRAGAVTVSPGRFADVLASKQLDLLRELMPRLSRVAVLVNVGNPLHAPQIAATRDAVQSTQAVLLTVEIRSAAQLDDAFATLAGGSAEGLLVPPDTVFRTYRQRIAELAAAARLPAIYGYRDHVDAGGLISYGPKLEENYRRAATYVDKILKGAKPSDLPIEQPTKIELVINLKTAKALGIEVPPTLLARADEVIE